MTALDDIFASLSSALSQGNRAVLEAEPGAGKSTRVPIALLDQPWLGDQRILLLEPRRLAARAVAERLAHNLGEQLGDRIGLTTREDRVLSDAVRVEVVTEGLLTRRLQRDPELSGVGLVIFDEAHERSLHSDLAMALCLDSQSGLRPDLRVLLMSATVDRVGLSRLMPDVPVLSCAGRQFPVEIVWRPQPNPRERSAAVASAVRSALAEHSGDILVFLPGMREIRQVSRQLGSSLAEGVEVVQLHGGLSSEAQRVVLTPAVGRRVVLSSAIAETSITLPGVRVVIDLGLERRAVCDPATGITQLHTREASQASATQRAGRAGRVANGVCIRLWSEVAHTRRASHWRAEVLDADLADLVLQLRSWGVGNPDQLNWQDCPPSARIAAAEGALKNLGLLGEAGQVSTKGGLVSALGLPVRLGALAVQGRVHGCAEEAFRLVALLSEAPRAERCSEDFLRSARGGSVRRLLQRLRQQLPDRAVAEPLSIDTVLARVFHDRIGRRRSGSQYRYQLSNGLGVTLADDDPLSGIDGIVVFEVAGTTNNAAGEQRIARAVPLDIDNVVAANPSLLSEQTDIDWDDEAGRVVARRRVCLGQLVISDTPLEAVDGVALVSGLMKGVRQRGLGILDWSEAARLLQHRVAFVRERATQENELPDFDDDTLLSEIDDWLAPRVVGCRTLHDLRRVSMDEVLNGMLSWPQRQYLEQMAPTTLALPSGRMATLQYTAEEAVLSVKLQEMFGCTRNPTIMQGREPVGLHLLSPAGRPLAVTRDLESFWLGAYKDVRKEMRGRYPKHPWPDNPMEAEATALTKRALADRQSRDRK